MALILTIESTENEKDLVSIIEGSFPDSIIISANKSHAGIELAIESYPDVIILGAFTNNPEQIEFCSKVKKDERLQDIPLIFLITNPENIEIRRKALKSGADALISYPLYDLELTALIRLVAKTKKQPKTKTLFEEEENFRFHSEKSMDQMSFFAGKDVLKLVHELEVHQIELELQKKELRNAKNKAEETLKDNNSRLELAMQSAKKAWWSMNIKTGNITFDRRKAEMLGYPPEILKHYSDYMVLIHPDDSKKVKDAMRSYLTGLSDKYKAEYRIVNQTGTYLWFHDIGAVEKRDNNGNPLTIAGIVTDITDRKNTEAKLRKSEAKFRSIFNTLQDAYLQTDINGNFVLASPSAVRMFGFESPEEITETPASELYARNSDWEKMLKELKTKGKLTDYIAEGKQKNGIRFWISMNVQFTYESGNITGTMGVIRDITERKKHEDKINTLTTAVEQSQLSIVITDINGNIEYINPKFSEVTGYSSVEAIGKNLSLIKSGTTPDIDYQQLWETISSGRNWNGEFVNRKKNGEFFYQLASISPVIDQNNQINHYIAIMEDITEKKQLIDDLIGAKEKAEESDRLKTSFLANMSHEIRTPLNSIIGFSELLLTSDLKPEHQTKFILNIKKSGDGLLSIISDIMNISMLETGQIKLIKHRFCMNNLILDIYHEYTYKEEKEIEFRLNIPDQETTIFIESDEARIRQILTNFINNAFKFTKKGFIEIGLLKISGSIQIYVKDTGIGIPKESHKIIFERFQQLETTYTRKYYGNGLGLTISKQLADLLGGKIRMESKPGKGSTFYLSFNTEQNI
jgi:PAS domain S-box-containing protein